MIPVFYRQEQSCADNKSFSPSAGKPALVMEDWLNHPVISKHIVEIAFAPATDKELCSAHDPAYVEGVLSCEMPNGFNNTSQEVAASLRYTTGSMLSACKSLMESRERGMHGVRVSPTSGFHHAGYAHGHGFCTFNGLMVTACRLKELGLLDKVLILDFDQHYGDGTQDIIDTLGLDWVKHITASKSYSNADEAMQYLNSPFFKRDIGWADLVIYQAGADIHVDDPLGGIMTTEQMKERDSAIFWMCSHYGASLCWNLAGGYKRDDKGTIEPVLALHRQTMLECIKAYN